MNYFVTCEEALRIIHNLAKATEPGIVRVSGRELITGLPRVSVKALASRGDGSYDVEAARLELRSTDRAQEVVRAGTKLYVRFVSRSVLHTVLPIEPTAP